MQHLNKDLSVILKDKVKILIPKGFNKIMLNLSGGTDSAMLLWQLLKLLKSNNVVLDEIIALTGVDLYRPTSEWNAREIFLEIKEQFPEQNMKHEIFKYWKRREKRIYHKDYEAQFMEKENIRALYHGRTANPPQDVQIKMNMWDDVARPKEREVDAEKRDEYNFLIKRKQKYVFAVPWERVDKKFITSLYNEEPFMKQKIFPLTASCISHSEKETEYWSKPCKICWWCKEKKWAFNRYDGEDIE
tara:strand:- start:96 stop:830 length:735 start_codon:yes stop_codon:yes gene_type:complete